jgi:predicted RNA methylase
MNELEQMLDQVYEANEGSEVLEDYMRRHGINSAGVLTVYDDETADLVARSVADKIEGKTVVEIGGGIGLLAFHLAQYAKRVYCIEADPNWASSFIAALLAHKPVNVSYLFGAAQEFAGTIRGDVALFCTHSDAAGMARVGALFAPVVIDVYADASKAVRPDLAPLRNLPRL